MEGEAIAPLEVGFERFDREGKLELSKFISGFDTSHSVFVLFNLIYLPLLAKRLARTCLDSSRAWHLKKRELSDKAGIEGSRISSQGKISKSPIVQCLLLFNYKYVPWPIGNFMVYCFGEQNFSSILIQVRVLGTRIEITMQGALVSGMEVYRYELPVKFKCLAAFFLDKKQAILNIPTHFLEAKVIFFFKMKRLFPIKLASGMLEPQKHNLLKNAILYRGSKSKKFIKDEKWFTCRNTTPTFTRANYSSEPLCTFFLSLVSKQPQRQNKCKF
ncbi:hypothetical protein EGR_08370 [Echinococcus granulosus]|uniref:Uncharacterized protein n=1 Tax=Echinococcus granulosus TaxID=6210 RepID=W6UF67_ECHGR|nr:hypothetical protein EGR_08370 [Echinococcus granulosus]EUB56792.1 hypothetical protein EGR_08370 [Echinococcus granulosus]